MNPTLCILDDEIDIVEMLQMFLEEDFRVVTFTDPTKCLLALKSNPVDILLSDIRMPGLNGIQVTKEVRKSSPKTKIVLMTGHAQSSEDKRIAIDAGASTLIFKPFDSPPSLISVLKKVLATAIPIKKSVLVLDDEPDLAELISELLSDDFDCEIVCSFSEAEKRLSETSFDAIITDLVMPSVSTEKIVTKLLEKAPNAKIIALSGHSEDSPVVELARKSGAHHFISKPLDSANFKDTITWMIQ
jgi:DNA-binding NtrC family response regulator